MPRFMAPVSRLVHLLAISLFALCNSIVNTTVVLGGLMLFTPLSLTGANLTVLNGGEGLADLVGQVVGQGFTLFQGLRQGLGIDGLRHVMIEARTFRSLAILRLPVAGQRHEESISSGGIGTRLNMKSARLI